MSQKFEVECELARLPSHIRAIIDEFSVSSSEGYASWVDGNGEEEGHLEFREECRGIDIEDFLREKRKDK